MHRKTHKCKDSFSHETCRMEWSTLCFSVCDLNWSNYHFGGKKGEVSPCSLLLSTVSAAKRRHWCWHHLGCLHLPVVTEWSLPDHFSQVTSHLVLTASDHAMTSARFKWTVLKCSAMTICRKIDRMKTKQQHGLKYEEEKKSRTAFLVTYAPESPYTNNEVFGGAQEEMVSLDVVYWSHWLQGLTASCCLTPARVRRTSCHGNSRDFLFCCITALNVKLCRSPHCS